jgi:hypothetical protein
VLAIAPLASLVLVATVASTPVGAAGAVQLGTATPFAVLAGTAVSDVPTSALTGDVGLSPTAGTAITGLTQSEVTGTMYSTDGTGPAGTLNDPALLTSAKNDLTTAYVAAAGQTPTSTFASGDNQLGGQTLTAGVYAFGHASTANITASSPLVLDGQGNADAVFVFQASSDLVTGSGSAVQLVNGAQACNVYWQVSSSATLSSSSTFVGTLMALTLGHPRHGCHRPGPGPRPQRRGDPGRQRHHRAADLHRIGDDPDHHHAGRHHSGRHRDRRHD